MGGAPPPRAPMTVCREVNGVKLIARSVSGIELKDLRSLPTRARSRSAPASWLLWAYPPTQGRHRGGRHRRSHQALQRGHLVKKGAEALGGKGAAAPRHWRRPAAGRVKPTPRSSGRSGALAADRRKPSPNLCMDSVSLPAGARAMPRDKIRELRRASIWPRAGRWASASPRGRPAAGRAHRDQSVAGRSNRCPISAPLSLTSIY